MIPIKLADRLHNMRTIEYLPKQKQVQTSKETLEVYAPLAHRLGIHAFKWELEDLAFETLHPRKYEEIKALVADRRANREATCARPRRGSRQSSRRPTCRPRSPRARSTSTPSTRRWRRRVTSSTRSTTSPRCAYRRARGGGDARLLRSARDHPLALEADAGPVQGLRRDAEAQPLSVAPYDGDRPLGDAARDPGAHPGDARGGGVRGRRALALQARAGRQARRRVARRG